VAQEWYYSKSGQQKGPVIAQKLKELAISGQLRPSDLVWHEGMAEWAQAQKVKGLFPKAPFTAPPPLPPTSTTSVSETSSASLPPVPPLPQPSTATNPLTRRFLGVPRWVWGSIGASVLVLGGIRGYLETSGGTAGPKTGFTADTAKRDDGEQMALQRSQSVNDLKVLLLAMLYYENAHECFPPSASYSPEGKPLLSWRVHLLPYIDKACSGFSDHQQGVETRLYEQFHLNESWDSPHNRTLIAKMPGGYRLPGSTLTDKGRTNYVVVVGPETVFNGPKGTGISEITDGTSNTIMIVECDDEHASIWTTPDDLPFDRTNPARGLGGHFGGGFNAAMCDGSVQFVSLPQPVEILRAMFTKAGDETSNRGE